METLKNKIDFVVVVAVNMANANGDPLNGNRPRTDYAGLGEMSDVCIKRKLRNRMQDMDQKIFVQSDDRCDDGYPTLKARADALIGTVSEKKTEKGKKSDDKDSAKMKESTGLTRDEYAQKACETFLDVRAFGQVFAYGSKKSEDDAGSGKGVSVGVRGPVSIHQAVSVSPVEVVSMQITKSVSGDKKDGKERGSDTMGMKHFVKFGVYVVKGSINVQLAEKTGFSEEDAEIVKECIRTMFINDSSAARPDGSMEVIKLFWFTHNCKDGQYSSAKVHRSIRVVLKDNILVPTSMDDYVITVEELPDLSVEVIEGV